jgi:hypothetical protein
MHTERRDEARPRQPHPQTHTPHSTTPHPRRGVHRDRVPHHLPPLRGDDGARGQRLPGALPGVGRRLGVPVLGGVAGLRSCEGLPGAPTRRHAAVFQAPPPPRPRRPPSQRFPPLPPPPGPRPPGVRGRQRHRRRVRRAERRAAGRPADAVPRGAQQVGGRFGGPRRPAAAAAFASQGCVRLGASGGRADTQASLLGRPPTPPALLAPPPPSDALLNMQNDLPLLSDYDKECLATLGQVPRGGGRSGLAGGASAPRGARREQRTCRSNPPPPPHPHPPPHPTPPPPHPTPPHPTPPHPTPIPHPTPPPPPPPGV